MLVFSPLLILNWLSGWKIFFEALAELSLSLYPPKQQIRGCYFEVEFSSVSSRSLMPASSSNDEVLLEMSAARFPAPVFAKFAIPAWLPLVFLISTPTPKLYLFDPLVLYPLYCFACGGGVLETIVLLLMQCRTVVRKKCILQSWNPALLVKAVKAAPARWIFE